MTPVSYFVTTFFIPSIEIFAARARIQLLIAVAYANRFRNAQNTRI